MLFKAKNTTTEPSGNSSRMISGGTRYYVDGREQFTNGFGTVGGPYGLAWTIGWEGGRWVTERKAYRDFKNWFYEDLLNE